MFERIFGGSEEQQLQFLEIRSIATIAALVIALVMSPFVPEASALIAAVMIFIWGWSVIKSWFGVTVVGILFSGNVVWGVILFLLYVVGAYLVGIFFAVIGVIRWIWLRVKRAVG